MKAQGLIVDQHGPSFSIRGRAGAGCRLHSGFGSLSIHLSRASLDAKERRTRPPGSGDCARDYRETAIGLAVVLVPEHKTEKPPLTAA